MLEVKAYLNKRRNIMKNQEVLNETIDKHVDLWDENDPYGGKRYCGGVDVLMNLWTALVFAAAVGAVALVAVLRLKGGF